MGEVVFILAGSPLTPEALTKSTTTLGFPPFTSRAKTLGANLMFNNTFRVNLVSVDSVLIFLTNGEAADAGEQIRTAIINEAKTATIKEFFLNPANAVILRVSEGFG